MQKTGILSSSIDSETYTDDRSTRLSYKCWSYESTCLFSPRGNLHFPEFDDEEQVPSVDMRGSASEPNWRQIFESRYVHAGSDSLP